jgi:hypothetical protein
MPRGGWVKPEPERRWSNLVSVGVLTWVLPPFFGIRHQASLFDYAPASLVTTVDEQLARYDRLLETPWWRALLPGGPVR